MVTLTLPDGSTRAYDGPITGGEVAADIGPGLAKAALAVKINGEMADLSQPIDQDSAFAIITAKDEEALELLRHDAAHIMAEAVQELYPDVQVTIGPAIENGFYYDFARAEPFVPEDLEKIEKRMAEIVDRDEAITREVWTRTDAINFFKNAGEHYKAQIIESIPDDQDIRLYRQGNFIDLCRGPHLPSTGKLGKAFKLMKLARSEERRVGKEWRARWSS